MVFRWLFLRNLLSDFVEITLDSLINRIWVCQNYTENFDYLRTHKMILFWGFLDKVERCEVVDAAWWGWFFISQDGRHFHVNWGILVCSAIYKFKDSSRTKFNQRVIYYLVKRRIRVYIIIHVESATWSNRSGQPSKMILAVISHYFTLYNNAEMIEILEHTYYLI